MDRIGDSHRTLKHKELVQIIQVVQVAEDKDGNQVEHILESVRRPLPLPYNESA